MPGWIAERNRLEPELANADTLPNIITLHPAAIQRYREQVEYLARALNHHLVEGIRNPRTPPVHWSQRP